MFPDMEGSMVVAPPWMGIMVLSCTWVGPMVWALENGGVVISDGAMITVGIGEAMILACTWIRLRFRGAHIRGGVTGWLVRG